MPPARLVFLALAFLALSGNAAKDVAAKRCAYALRDLRTSIAKAKRKIEKPWDFRIRSQDPLAFERADRDLRIAEADRILEKAETFARLKGMPAKIIEIDDEFPLDDGTLELFKRRVLQILPGWQTELNREAREVKKEFNAILVYDPFLHLAGTDACVDFSHRGTVFSIFPESFENLRLMGEKNHEWVHLRSGRLLDQEIPNLYQVSIHQLQKSNRQTSVDLKYDSLPLDEIPAWTESVGEDRTAIERALRILNAAQHEMKRLLRRKWQIFFFDRTRPISTDPETMVRLPIAGVFTDSKSPCFEFTLLEPDLRHLHVRGMKVLERISEDQAHKNAAYLRIKTAAESHLRAKLTRILEVTTQIIARLEGTKSAPTPAERNTALQRAVNLARDSFDNG